MSLAYYNENDPFAAAWLRELIKAGHIAPGDVDERGIEDVRPKELEKYTQCHFFAGIGVWSYALRQAGWPDNRPVWTGSCPCQPFSAAGKSAGFVDERHLWPHWFHLITQCRPLRIFGEQVASKDGLTWLDLVQTDLEGAGYASGAVDLCAAGVGAPHIRQRLWVIAERLEYAEHKPEGSARSLPEGFRDTFRTSETSGLADAKDGGRNKECANDERVGKRDTPQRRPSGHDPSSTPCGLADANGDGRPGPTNGFWKDVDWLGCRDGKFRSVEPNTFPLANGPPARVGRLRGYGNAINAEVAKEIIMAYIAGENDHE